MLARVWPAAGAFQAGPCLASEPQVMPQYGAAAWAGAASAIAVNDTARRTSRRIGVRNMAGLLASAPPSLVGTRQGPPTRVLALWAASDIKRRFWAGRLACHDSFSRCRL